VTELSDSVAWPSRDPEWVGKVALIGLIGLIPVAGWLCQLGWMLAALDNLRAERPVLPAAGFAHLRRGVNLAVVIVGYSFALLVVCTALFGAGLAVALSAGGRGASAAGLLLILLSYAVLIVVWLGLVALMPALVVATEHGGIGRGLNLPAVLRLAAANVEESMRAGLFALVASIIGGLGAIACWIGQSFTTPYGYAVLAGVVHHYERTVLPMAAATPVA
jgi:hypothetical protein